MREERRRYGTVSSGRPRTATSAEPRTFVHANTNTPDPAQPEFTVAEKSALAMLRCGRSFGEAAESCGLEVQRVMQLWKALH